VPDIWVPKYSYRTFTSILTTIVAYGYQSNVFPIFNSLRISTPAEYSKVQTMSLFMTFVLYIIVAIVGLVSFGSAIHSSVLLNYGELRLPDGSTLFSTSLVQASFIAVIICHIPFVFYAGKEGALMSISEYIHQTVSNSFTGK